MNFLNSQVTKSTNGKRVLSPAPTRTQLTHLPGIRVKSFGTAPSGSINKVTYNGITLSSISKYGILLEQNYDGGDLHGTAGTNVPITGLTIENITGTGAVASSGFNVVVTCGSTTSCTGWTWSKVSVTGGSKVYGSCSNVPSVTKCS